MSDIPVWLRDLVKIRARDRCEYCGLSQIGQEATFHIDHYVPRSGDGATHQDNLALACVSCSLKKGARQLVEDPLTGIPTTLFNPRQEDWDEHFRWNGIIAVGLTPKGRATVEALDLNRPTILVIRQEESARGRHPPT